MLIRDLREDALPFLREHALRSSRVAAGPAAAAEGAPASHPAGVDVPQGLGVEGHRGSGIGTALMEAIHTRAREQGLTQVSLSVDADNPAKRLYERLGCVDYPPGHEHGRMLLELT
jgi:GNAT superfamily N-acetyltransferase